MANKLLVICGPTATGKTALGVRLAKKFKGEIVSADSRQVYKEMDVGTGKDLPVGAKLRIANCELRIADYQIGYYQIKGVKIWLYDVVEPDHHFSVADYVKCANLVIKDIWKRKKLPILVGGTGLYIKAVIDGIETIGIPPDWKLRKKLSGYQVIRLSELLKKLDPEKWKRMNESDKKNPRRLIRAIEIALQSPNKIQNSKFKIQKVLFIGLTAPYKVLYERIDKRVDKRVKQGIIEEIKNLLAKGYTFENSILGETIGYKEWRECFKNSKFQIPNSKLEEIVQRWKYDEHAYSRRQMTWFKKDKRINWFGITKRGFKKEIEKKIKNWLGNSFVS